MIMYILTFKRFFLNLKGLSDGKGVSITKKRIWFRSTFFIDFHKIFESQYLMNDLMDFVEVLFYLEFSL